MTQPIKILWCAVFGASLFLLPARVTAQSSTATESKGGGSKSAAVYKSLIAENYGRLPLSFEANAGQTDSRVKFLSRGAGYTLFLTPTEAVLGLNKDQDKGVGLRAANYKSTREAQSFVLRMRLLGANPHAEMTGLELLPGKSNYFLGNDPTKWHTNVPTFSRVRYSEVYSGIDLVFYGSQRRLEYDFVVAPGADPRQISLGLPDATKISLDADGNVILRYGGKELQLTKPHVYQDVAGKRTEIAGGYFLKGHRLSFQIASYDHNQALTIDPQLVYSTYLGGSSGDSGNAIALDSAGNAYVTGSTFSADFPVTPGALQVAQHGSQDVFVAKLNASGTGLLYSAVIGGNSFDSAHAIAVDQSGNVYLTGLTNSHDFPVSAKAFQPTYGPDVSITTGTFICGNGFHAFAVKLNTAGNQLVYSTYLEGTGNDLGYGIAIDSVGNAYITGNTISTDFPTTPGAYQTAFGGGESTGTCVHPSDAFVTKLNPTGTGLVYSTFLGGSDNEGTVGGIAVDSSGNAFITGSTQSSNFPTTTGAFQTKSGGGTASTGVAQPDVFITKLNPSGSALIYSTYLGGSGEDIGYGIALDSSENAYVTGLTTSTNFPVTSGAIQSVFGGGPFDAFVAELNASGSALVYSTYLGGSNDDEATAIAVDSLGSAYITGTSNSTNYPVTANAIQAANKGGYDAFVTKVSPQGQSLVYSTYLGGTDDDQGNGIAVDGSGNAFVTGYSFASDFPLKNPIQSTNRALSNGNTNAFVAEIGSSLTGTTPSATTLTSSATQTVFGQSVTFTATVSGAGGTPTGAMVFSDAGSSIGSLSLSNGQAALTISSLGTGPHSITASYSGDATFAASTSAAVPETVSQAGTTVALTSSSVSVSFGQSVTFTAMVSVVSPGAGTPTGNISFNDGANTLATMPVTSSGVVSFSTSSLAIGTHSIAAAYAGDTNFQAHTSGEVAVVVNWPAPYQGPPSVLSITAGSGPVGMALNPATERIYVANQSSNNVTVIDATTNLVVTTIPVGKAPSAVAVNAQTNTIYVADRDSADVAIINGASNSVTYVGVPSTGAPDSIAVEPGTGNVYVGTGGPGILAVINTTTNQVMYPDPSALFGPIALASSPLSGRMYVADVLDSDLEIYEGATTFLLNSVSMAKPQALAVNAPSVNVADGTGGLRVIDETGMTAPLQFAAGSNPHAIATNPADNTIYLADQSPAAGQAATVTQFAASNNSVVATYAVGPSAVPARTPSPNKIAIDTAANLVYVANEGSNTVSIIDGGVRNVLPTVTTGTTPTAILVDPLKCAAYVTNFGSGTVSVIQPSVNGSAVCLSKGSLVFGRVPVGSNSAAQTVILTNIGNTALSISSINSPAGFNETDNCPAVAPSTVRLIPPGGQCAIQEVFAASTNGISTGNLAITDNAGGSPHIVALSADAVLPTTTQLTLNNPVVYGQAVSMSAQVVGTPGTPTGSVTFFEDGQTLLKTVKVGAGAVASFTTSFPFLLPVGSQHTITATYNGDLNFGGSSSTATPIVVNKDATFFSQAQQLTPPLGVQVTVDAFSPGGGIPTGTVVFQVGQSNVASLTLDAQATGTAPGFLPPGLYQLTAQYLGDANFLPSTSQQFPVLVKAPTATTIKSSSPTVVVGNSVTLTVTVTAHPEIASNGISGTLIFRDGPTEIGQSPIASAGATASLTTPGFATGASPALSIGQHSITVEYQDSTGDYLGSRSAPLDQIVAPPPSNTPTPLCACSQTGKYQVPAVPVDPTDNPLVSPQGTYTVTPNIDGSGMLLGIDVFNSSGKDILSVQSVSGTLSWGFSPDEDRLVTHFLTGQQGSQIDNITVYDLSVIPVVKVVGAQSPAQSPAGAISHVSFSPSGRYFLMNFVYGSPGPGLQQADLDIYLVQRVASDMLLYRASLIFTQSADENNGVLGQGFSPNNPETSFVYAYLDSNSQPQWNLVSLATPQKVLATQTLNQPADFWEYSPCGDVIAVVMQTSPLGQPVQAEINLFDTVTGALLPGSGATFSPNTSILTLFCNSAGQQVQIGNQTPTTLSPNTSCANTPTGNNVTVIPQDQGSGLAPVTITFGSVTAPGTTTVVASTNLPAIPVNFQLGNPPIGFDVSTNATFSNPPGASVCVSYANIAFSSGAPLALMHYQGGQLVNGTWINGTWVTPSPQTIDKVHQIICAPVSSFSPFIVAEQVSSPTVSSITAPSVVYGTPASVTVSVNSSTGTVAGAVMLSVDGGATISLPLSNGSAIFNLGVLNAGSHSLSANFAAQGNFPASSATGSLSVARAPLNVAANNPTRPYGANNPAFTVNFSSFVNGENSSVLAGLLSCATAASPSSPVGMYAIACAGLSSPNYLISFVNGTLFVTPEATSLNVTLAPLSILVGNSTTATITLTAPDMVIPIDPSVLAPITLTSPSFSSDILSNNGVCTPVPSATPGIASCTVNLTSVEPNGRTLNASFAGSANLVTSSATANLIVTAALQSQQVCIKSDFRNVPVPGGSYLWFNSIFKVRDVTKQLIHISFFKSNVQFQYTDPAGNAVTVNQGLPDARITIDPNATAASTSFDAVNNVWITTIPWDLDDNAFLTGMPWSVPSAGLPADVEPVMMCGTFASDVASVDIGWRWSAAAYSGFSSDNNALGVKPMNTDYDNPPANRDNAGTPENFKPTLIPGGRGKGGKNYTGSYSGSAEIE